jgi:hypothetical protein
MARAGITCADMATRLGASPGEIRRAVADLQAIAGEIELGDRPATSSGCDWDAYWGALRP